MRFGKKLALMVDQDLRHGRELRPYISHKRLKQMLSDIVRMQRDGCDKSTENCVYLDFRMQLDCDYEQIREHLSVQLRTLGSTLDETLSESLSLGISDSCSLKSLISVYKQILNDSCLKLHEMLNDSIMSLWVSLSASVAAVCDKYLVLVETFRTISAYGEINVAGFRKIIKQFHKQVPDAPSAFLEPKYADIALDLLRTQNRIEGFRQNLDEITRALSATIVPLPQAELGTETITALLYQTDSQKDQCSNPKSEQITTISFPQIHP